jgi:hypothetical protein
MPGVSPPSDGGYNYYQKTITELEDELIKEHKRNEERRDAQVKSLENNYHEAIRKNEEAAERTIATNRDKANETIQNDRAYQKSEVDRVKQDTYDKWGRFQGADADTVKTQLQSFKETSEAQRSRDVANLSDQQEGYEKKIDQIYREQQLQMENAIQAAHDSHSQDYERATGDEKEAFNSYKKQAENNYERLNKERMEDMNFQRRRAEEAISEMDYVYNKKLNSMEKADTKSLVAQNKEHERRMAYAAQEARDSRENEVAQLQQTIEEFASMDSKYKKEKAQGAYEARKEFDDDNNLKIKLLDEGYQGEIGKLKQQAKEADRYNTYVHNRSLSEKDKHFTKAIQNLTQDNHEKTQDLQNTFMRDRAQVELQRQRDTQNAESAREAQLHQAAEARNKALENQAFQFQRTLTNQKVNDQDKIRILEKELTYKNTSADTASVSPAAEEAIRKKVIGEYGKAFDAEQNRNKDTTDSIVRTYSNLVQDTISERDAKDAQMQRSFANQSNQDRNQLLEHITDIDFMKDLTLRSKDEEMNRQQTNLTRSYSNMLDKQKRSYEEVLSNLRSDFNAKTVQQRQEAEFNQRMKQRDSTARENELVRTYNKKLADLKSEAQVSHDDLKSSADKAIRDNDRKNKQILDEQAKSYEQRIAQTEAQYKERERYLNQNHEDELERLRRAHAYSLQKKS